MTYAEEPAVLDPAAAMEKMGMDKATLATMTGVFARELGEWTDFFTLAVGAERKTIRRKAHKLMHDAASVGAYEVSHCAELVEEAVRGKDSDDTLEERREMLVEALWRVSGALEEAVSGE